MTFILGNSGFPPPKREMESDSCRFERFFGPASPRFAVAGARFEIESRGGIPWFVYRFLAEHSSLAVFVDHTPLNVYLEEGGSGCVSR